MMLFTNTTLFRFTGFMPHSLVLYAHTHTLTYICMSLVGKTGALLVALIFRNNKEFTYNKHFVVVVPKVTHS